MFKFSAAMFLLMAGCTTQPSSEFDLSWQQGDEWHLAAKYRMSTGADDGLGLSAMRAWSDDVIWSYQAVEVGLQPTADDELYRFAVRADGSLATVDVVRATVDPAFNDDSALLAEDPVVYLVFRADQDRLVGVVTYSVVGGERQERAFSVEEGWLDLAQSNLAAAPSYLAPFGFARDLEVDAVDISFEDGLGGGDVTSRYEPGQPWPVHTVSDNVEARLLTNDDMGRFRTHRNARSEAPPDYDFRAALAAGLPLDASIRLDPSDIAAGGWSSQVPSGYTPWAGYWWPSQEAELVFGHSNKTPSYLVQDASHTLKVELQDIWLEASQATDSAVLEERIAAYHDKYAELSEFLFAFYDLLRDDLDGGRVTLNNGVLSHEFDGWYFAVDDMSPIDKWALHVYFSGDDSSENPFRMAAWQILNTFHPTGPGWWGRDSGWASASVLTHEPSASLMTAVQVGDRVESIEYGVADLKGLLTEAHHHVSGHTYGDRYETSGDDISDLTPAAFHRLISFYHRDQQVPVVFDTQAGEQVWRHPAYASDVTLLEVTTGSVAANVNTADQQQLAGVMGDELATDVVSHRETYGPFGSVDELVDVAGLSKGDLETLRPQVTVEREQRMFEVEAEVWYADNYVEPDYVGISDEPEGFSEVYLYTLYTDSWGHVTGGHWADDAQHPDFAFVPYDNPAVAGQNSGENPGFRYDLFRELVTDLDRH
jgi:hypothetical protein